MSAKTLEEIAVFLEAIKFKKKLVGGVAEDDVWCVLERLQKEYRSVVEAAEQRCGVLLDERGRIILRQQEEILQLRAQAKLSERGDAGE